MAIDQYRPELAKRRMAFEIAYEQLQEAMSRTYNALIENDENRKSKVTTEEAEEAVKDFLEMAGSAAEWLNSKIQVGTLEEQDAWG